MKERKSRGRGWRRRNTTGSLLELAVTRTRKPVRSCWSNMMTQPPHWQSGRGQVPRPAVAHLGVVAGENLERDGRDELADEVQPLLVEADLLHVDVVRRHRLVAAGDTLVLGRKGRSFTMINDAVPTLFNTSLHFKGPVDNKKVKRLQQIESQ